MDKEFRLKRRTKQLDFWNTRTKVQMMAGGFGNGKSTGVCVKAIQIASDYPGSRGLIARATHTQLRDTTMKTYFEWLPDADVKRMPTKDDPTLYLTNGSTVKFGHIRQEGKGQGEAVSNVLSAEYDYIVIDQVEDPSITHKDFTDMLGRLRRQTPYRGNDITMPRTGPRWLILACNPTRNWVYRKLVRPYELWMEKRIQSPDLLIDPDTGELLISIFNAPTSENKDNLPSDYIPTLRASHKGAMGDRFIDGKWGAYEGLVYPDFDLTTHVVAHADVVTHFKKSRELFFLPINQGFDHGLAVPSCYLLTYFDPKGNLCVMDGVYEKEIQPRAFAKKVTDVRNLYGIEHDSEIYADQAIFRRGNGTADKLGTRISSIYHELGLNMVRASRDKSSGIVTVNSFLHIDTAHQNPFTGGWGAPHLYVSDKLTWFIDEISDYYWKKSSSGEEKDETRDVNDHAMDTLRYCLTTVDPIAASRPRVRKVPPVWMQWGEIDYATRDSRAARYGR